MRKSYILEEIHLTDSVDVYSSVNKEHFSLFFQSSNIISPNTVLFICYFAKQEKKIRMEFVFWM